MNRRDFIRAAAGFAAAIGIGATVKLPEIEFTEPEKEAITDVFGIHAGDLVATDGEGCVMPAALDAINAYTRGFPIGVAVSDAVAEDEFVLVSLGSGIVRCKGVEKRR